MIDELNAALGFISRIGSWVHGLSGWTRTVLMCLLIGFLCKKWKRIPNTRIPTIIVFSGIIIGMGLADPFDGSKMPFHFWLCTEGVFGGLAGGTAWALHANRRRIPVVKHLFLDEDTDSNPRPFVNPLQQHPRKPQE